MVTVYVRDFGIGISKENQKKIFDRFYRVRSKYPKPVSGLGLGLYISSQIINLHNGKLWVESVTEKGSIFYFSIPVE